VFLAVQQRERETALLRAIAATPRQVQRLILLEVLAIAVPAAVVGLLPGLLLGRILLDQLAGTDAVAQTVNLRTGGLTVAVGAGVTLVAALAGAVLAARRASTVPPVAALAATAESPAATPWPTRRRLISGSVITAVGLSMGVTTLVRENGPLLSSTAGPAGVAVAVGLALLAPAFAAALGRVLAHAPAIVARLAARTLHTRARQQGTLIAPLTLLVGVAGGTLSMQRIEDDLPATAGPQLAPVNYLIVVAIVGFAVVAAANTLITATRGRERDFRLLALIGATRRQVLAVVGAEALATTAVAAVLGGVAALVTVLPFSVVRTGTAIPDGAIGLFLVVVAIALAITVGASMPTASHLLRRSSIDR
jgi:putative ABC transport system permease protein